MVTFKRENGKFIVTENNRKFTFRTFRIAWLCVRIANGETKNLDFLRRIET